MRKGALEAISHVDWMPAWGEQRISSMIAVRPDWCVSRQRTWGVPIPLFVDKESGRTAPANGGVSSRRSRSGWSAAGSMPGSMWTRRSCWAPTPRNTTRPPTSWMCGSIPGVVHHCVSRLRPEITAPVGFVPRGVRPASRLVPQLAADLGRDARSRTVSRRADARIHRGRERPQDVQVGRQHAGAAEAHEHAWVPMWCACGLPRPTTRTK